MEPIMHFLIPLLILLVVYPKVNKKLAIPLALLALTPDLDFFIDFTHRFLFHSIFFPIIISLTIYFLSKNLQIALISFYYLISHLVLDMATGAIALFWPLYQRLIEIDISLNSWWQFVFSIKTYPMEKVKEHMIAYPSYFFTREGIIVILFLAIMLLIIHKKEIIKLFRK